jgi:hypothetical protein
MQKHSRYQGELVTQPRSNQFKIVSVEQCTAARRFQQYFSYTGIVAVSFIGEETGVLSFITGWLIAFVEPLVILFIYKSQSSESTTCHNL